MAFTFNPFETAFTVLVCLLYALGAYPPPLASGDLRQDGTGTSPATMEEAMLVPSSTSLVSPRQEQRPTPGALMVRAATPLDHMKGCPVP